MMTIDLQRYVTLFAVLCTCFSSTVLTAHAFSPSISPPRKLSTMTKSYSTPTKQMSDTLISHNTEVDYSAWLSNGRIAPWITFETAEQVASNLGYSVEEFEYRFADVEAYTSCDDEGDGLHECNMMEDFFHPTKWLHLRADITSALGSTKMSKLRPVSEDDIWSQPSQLISLADTITKRTMDWCDDFIRKSSQLSRNSIRTKVVPAFYGLEGIEDAVREASLELLQVEECKSFTGTFIVAAPDEANAYEDESQLATITSQNEEDFELSDLIDCETFLEFADDLSARLVDEAREYRKQKTENWVDIPIADYLTLIPFHPHSNINNGVDEGDAGEEMEQNNAPYPTLLLIRNNSNTPE